MSTLLPAQTDPTRLNEVCSVGDLVVSAISRGGDRVALISDDRQWTYRQLGALVSTVIQALTARGLRRGDAVATLSANRPEAFLITAASYVMGLRLTWMNPTSSEDDHTYILRDSGVTTLFVDPLSFSDPTGFDADPDAATKLKNATIEAQEQAKKDQQIDNSSVGDETVGDLAMTMSNETRGLSGGKPGELDQAKTDLANALYNNAKSSDPQKVAPVSGTAAPADAQTMRTVFTSRSSGGADPVAGRRNFGTSSQELKCRPAGNRLPGAAGRETVFAKFGPFSDTSHKGAVRQTYFYIFNAPGH